MVIELKPLPFGNYYLLERLAVGGMAEVYLAKCFGVAGFERLVALKRILPTIAEDDEFIAMFIDEAKIAGQLSHANIAQIFDLGKINQSYFIAMEYISGHDLRALWDRAKEQGGLPLPLACYVTQKICDGLDYAHRRRDNRGRPLGIIHRDVSPQNVLLSYDGDIKVIDFGIAKAANRMVRTQTGILKGKFAYMAPEQARGDPTDHRADIFAIGVIFYELLTGERAFRAESDFALLEKVRRVDVVPPRKARPELPRDLERIVYKALAKDAPDRYAWASALSADIDRFMSAHGVAYNKEELAAYVRRTFREEFGEEQRRLKLYQGYKPDDVKVPDAGKHEESSRADADQRTALHRDPSQDDGADGTKVIASLSDEDPSTSLPDEGRVEPTRARPPEGETQAWRGGTADSEYDSEEYESDEESEEAAGFDSQYTLPIDALPEKARHGLLKDDDEEDLTSTDADKQQRSEGLQLVASADIEEVPWADPAERPGLVDKRRLAVQATQVNVSRPGFSEEGSDEAYASSLEDATMVDSYPVPEDESSEAEDATGTEPVAVPPAGAGEPARDKERRREGTRPDVRGSSLGHVVRGAAAPPSTERVAASATTPRGIRPAAVPRPRDDEPLPASPHVGGNGSRNGASRPATPAKNGASPGQTPGRRPPQRAPERETFDPRLLSSPRMDPGAPPKRPLSALLGGVGVGLLFGVLLAGLVAVVGSDAGPNTFVVVSPGTATVRLGNEVLCDKTPCAVRLDEGRYELLFSGEGFDLFSKTVTVAGDGITVVEVPIRPRRLLRLESNPPGARVTLNGEALEGQTPLQLPELVLGERVKLKLERAGYEPLEELVEVPDVEGGVWRFELLASRTEWTVSVFPPDAVVVGTSGRARAGGTKVTVPRGKSTAVSVVRPGCEPASRALLGTGKPEEKVQVKLECQSFDGKVSIGSARRADIEIDGVAIGERTPLKDYPLPSGPHVVMLRRRDHAEPFAVLVSPGSTAVLNTRFR